MREKTTPEPGEPSRDALLVLDAPEGSIRRVWTMKAGEDDALGGEGAVGLQIEKYNERDLPRLMAIYDEGATISRLSNGERLAAGEDALRERFEKAFDGAPGRHRGAATHGARSLGRLPAAPRAAAAPTGAGNRS